MGLPRIIGSSTTRSQAITDIIQSVAVEQAAIANIINAESDKLQKVVTLNDDTQTALQAYNSVNSTVSAATFLQIILIKQLELFSGCLSPTPEPSPSIENISMEILPPDLGRTITKIDNQHFTIAKQSTTKNVGRSLIEILPTRTISLISAPEGVTLSENVITIDYAVVTEGKIVLIATEKNYETRIKIDFFDV